MILISILTVAGALLALFGTAAQADALLQKNHGKEGEAFKNQKKVFGSPFTLFWNVAVRRAHWKNMDLTSKLELREYGGLGARLYATLIVFVLIFLRAA